MYKINSILLCIFALILTSCMHVKDTTPALNVVPFVDISRYTGTWYEIARYPHKFQKGCIESRATYSLRDDGNLSVLNECYEESDKSRIRSAEGKAWIVDSETNAKLKVSFFWPFSGAYWIIDLGKNYEYAVIGHPGREYLWILSRSKVLDESVYEGILNRLKEQHYDISKLIRTQ
ncbi:lipocalin family protein [bacterium]|nr:lipocalin family protein [bacterium]